MKRPVASRIVLTGVALVAAAGWVGVQPQPDAGALAAGATVAPVRDRAAWQPSPVPSTGSSGLAAGSGEVQAAPRVAAPQGAVTQPGVRDRSAWQPSPIPGSSSTQPQTQSVGELSVPDGQPAQAAVTSAPGVTAALPASPLTRLGNWARGLLGLPSVGTGAPSLAPDALAGALPEPVISIDDVFSQDALEGVFHGTLPVERGEWKITTFYSRALGREDSYMAYLPPGYATSGQSYPTLYLLHGVGSADAHGVEEWLGYALTEDLDRMQALGLIEPMVVILPNGDQGYWMNQADGGPRWADYVAQDLVTNVDATFRTDTRRERRAIGGLSMGGHGALQLAYNHPELFSIAGAHSPTIRPYETSPEFFGDPAWFARYDPETLARTSDSVYRVRTWLDVGASDDKWRPGTREVASTLAQRGAPFEYHVFEGEHEGWYWKYYLPEYLHFYSDALHATSLTPKGAPVVTDQLLTAGVSQTLRSNPDTSVAGF